MTEFVFIRHGEPNYESVNDWAKIDVARNFGPLTENGVMQIENATKQLLGEEIDLIISSPFTRCLQGASIMARELKLSVTVEHDLHEWELDSSHRIYSKAGIKWLLWKFNHIKWNRFSKWENPKDTKTRVLKVLDKYLDYGKVIVSTHAMVIIYTLGLTNAPGYGEIVRVKYDGEHLEVI